MYWSNLFLKKIKIKVNFFFKGHIYVPSAVYQQGTYISLEQSKGLGVITNYGLISTFSLAGIRIMCPSGATSTFTHLLPSR